MTTQRSVFITRKVRFCAAHRYHNPDWSDERNKEVFGPCNRPFGHGHNYELEVTIAGDVDSATGMVMNLRDIDSVLREEVVSRMDHRHLNEELPEWKDQVPTTENISLELWRRLSPIFAERGARLFRVRLYESPDLYAEYFGESEANDNDEAPG